ncbi:MAG: dioxygenase [Betaproteobacteria bacterium]|nr:dioxygenase [Betaproteobacteria bacterium]
MARLPTLFVSHGSPLHALAGSDASRAWAAIARDLPRPRAVLMVSAHWETSLPMLTGARQLQTLHDFGGFPDALYALRYDAPGDTELAQAASALLKAAGQTAGIDGCRGIDHGAWVPLRWMYPEADVPIVQLSVQPQRGIAHHCHVGAALSGLRDDGVLIVGSGHVTHNLRDWMATMRQSQPLAYVDAFADWIAERLDAHDVEAIVDYRDRAPAAARAHPTEEHFVPLPVAWAAAGDAPRVERVHRGREGAALAMDAYLFH